MKKPRHTRKLDSTEQDLWIEEQVGTRNEDVLLVVMSMLWRSSNSSERSPLTQRTGGFRNCCHQLSLLQPCCRQPHLGPCESSRTPNKSGLQKLANVATVKIVAISEDDNPAPPRSTSAGSIVEEIEAQPKKSPPPMKFWRHARVTKRAGLEVILRRESVDYKIHRNW